MYNQSLSRENLAKSLKNSDFVNRADFNLRRQELVDAAVACLRQRPIIPVVSRTKVKKKYIYKIQDEGAEIVQRKISHTLKTISGITFIDRNTTIRQIRLLLEDNMPFRVYRLDVKNFYESIDYKRFLEKLSDNPAISKQTCDVCADLLNFQNRTLGIPRGFALSSTISEIIMRPFDNIIKHKAGVTFYARYVDDIFIITRRTEDPKEFLQVLEGHLPKGLKLNEKKHKRVIRDFAEMKVSKNTTLKVDYLGYEFTVKNTANSRKVSLDISPKKVRKIKSRVLYSFLNFHSVAQRCRTPNQLHAAFHLLKDRLKFLTGNFALYDYDTKRKRTSGIYFNYHLIDRTLPHSLRQLDNFLLEATRGKGNHIFSQAINFLNAKPTLNGRLTEIVNLSFYKGFSRITYFHFHPKRLEKIQKCWKYVE